MPTGRGLLDAKRAWDGPSGGGATGATARNRDFGALRPVAEIQWTSQASKTAIVRVDPRKIDTLRHLPDVLGVEARRLGQAMADRRAPALRPDRPPHLAGESVEDLAVPQGRPGRLGAPLKQCRCTLPDREQAHIRTRVRLRLDPRSLGPGRTPGPPGNPGGRRPCRSHGRSPRQGGVWVARRKDAFQCSCAYLAVESFERCIDRRRFPALPWARPAKGARA